MVTFLLKLIQTSDFTSNIVSTSLTSIACALLGCSCSGLVLWCPVQGLIFLGAGQVAARYLLFFFLIFPLHWVGVGIWSERPRVPAFQSCRMTANTLAYNKTSFHLFGSEKSFDYEQLGEFNYMRNITFK